LPIKEVLNIGSKSMMRKLLMALGVCLVCAFACQAGDSLPPTSHPDSSKWQDLFAPDFSNAIYLGLTKDLKGVVLEKSKWAFEKGLLVAHDGNTILTKDQHSNFILDLEFKNGENSNSGVFIYCSDLKNWVQNKLEIQILDDYGPQWVKESNTARCGAAYRRLAPSKQTVKKPGEWNRMTLWCLGPKVYEVLNGELVLQMDFRQWTSGQKTPDGRDIPPQYNKPLADLPTTGHIGLQGIHGKNNVQFRNVKIKIVEPAKQ
jgi:hypothetical protein